MKQTPMYELYARVAPKPADWPVLLTKLNEMLKKDLTGRKRLRRLRCHASRVR